MDKKGGETHSGGEPVETIFTLKWCYLHEPVGVASPINQAPIVTLLLIHVSVPLSILLGLWEATPVGYYITDGYRMYPPAKQFS